jgi:multidrug efflux pump subunit AcrB
MNHPIDRLVNYSLNGGLPVTILILATLLGLLALNFTAREEEPQIVVPVVDVIVEAQGLSARQVERQVTTPLEKLLAQIPGVEHVYSRSMTGQATVTLRFYVGEDREISILNAYNKLHSNLDKIPGVVTQWMVSPVEVDNVPILVLALWSDDPARTSDFELRRLAEEVSTFLQGVTDTSEVNIEGGRPRTIRVLPNPEGLAARQSTAADIVNALEASNVLQDAGPYILGNQSVVLQSGDFLRSVNELKQTVINVVNGRPVLLRDVAEIVDGPAEPESYGWLTFASTHPNYEGEYKHYPMTTISVAKQRGSNAVTVAEDVHKLVATIDNDFLPSDVHVEVMRDYGKTANDKVNQLASSLAFAVFTVVVFIAVFLGIRPALVVGLTVPISYGITLALDMAFGYTINRVTLFALILSLGLLVDDPITGVDNIERFIREKRGSLRECVVAAMSEIRAPLLLSTVTIIVAFVPLAFITGMMGPYMAPMAFNVPVAVSLSTLIAFVVTPWLSSKLLPASINSGAEKRPSLLVRLYQKLLTPLLYNRRKARWALWSVLGLFVLTVMLPMFRLVPLKLLPFDNKNEIQVLIDMPESATLEQTAAVTQQVASVVTKVNEVSAIAAYIGAPSPEDFNGMVRGYYRRIGSHMADLRVTLIDKQTREHQSHAVVLRLRSLVADLAQDGISIKVVESPPGPPVLSTLVAEIYGSMHTSYASLQSAADLIKQRLEREAFVSAVDTSVEAHQQLLRFIVDKPKAALSGISTADINETLLMANVGIDAGYLQLEQEARTLPILIRLPLNQRSSIADLERLQVKGRRGIVQQQLENGLEAAPQPLVALGELGHFESSIADTSIHHKDLKPVVYVYAEVSGRTPIEIVADVNADMSQHAEKMISEWDERTFFKLGGGDGWDVDDDINVSWTGEGEWQITVDVFRDMGLGYLFALIGIFFVLHYQTRSVSLALIIMSAIPLTVIGILPGFWLLNQTGERVVAGAPDPVLFTATAMIGMIALAGIVVRNSLILVEFISQSRASGLAIKEALVEAGAIRLRPILLTAGTTLLGNLIITLDPVFSGLALAIMFGIIASTFFTLLVVPVVYLLVFDDAVESKEL